MLWNTLFSHIVLTLRYLRTAARGRPSITASRKDHHMRNHFLLTLVFATASLPLFAQGRGDDVVPPSPSTSALRWSLGLGVISSPRPYVGAKNTVQPIPLVEVSYKDFYLQGIRAGFHLLEHGDLTLDARARMVFAGLDPDDSPDLAGMAERKSSVEGGLALDWKPGRYQISLTAFTDLLGRSGGQQLGLDLSRTWTFGGYRWGLTPAIGAVWQSADFVDYYFGVNPEEARPGRPPFQGSAALNLRASVLTYYRLSQRTSLIGLLSVQRLDNEISSSPIVDKPRGYFGLLGINYTFGAVQGGTTRPQGVSK